MQSFLIDSNLTKLFLAKLLLCVISNDSLRIEDIMIKYLLSVDYWSSVAYRDRLISHLIIIKMIILSETCSLNTQLSLNTGHL